MFNLKGKLGVMRKLLGMKVIPIAVVLSLLVLVIGVNVSLAQRPGGRGPRQANPNSIIKRGGNAEVILNDDGSITMTSLGPNNDDATTTTVSASRLERLPDTPSRNRRVTRTSDHYVTLYKLTTGEFQVNIGPDNDGKVFVYIFTLDPRACLRSYQFTSEDKSEQFSGGCQ